MGCPPPALPELSTVQAALCKTTESLVRELAQPTDRPPNWSATDWGIATAVAALHGVSPLLAGRLRWAGPPAWREFLEQQRSHTVAHHGRILQLLRLLDAFACEAGVAFVALKGAALHQMGLYRPGDRPMADLDLLTDPQHAPVMAQVLARAGYYQSGSSWKELVFEPSNPVNAVPFAEHNGNAIKVDLHVRVCERLPLSLIDITHHLMPTRPRPGLNTYPSQVSLMLHLLLHAAGAMPFRTLRMLQLHDLALVSARMSRSDWHELLDCEDSTGRLWWALPPLLLLVRYYGAVPGEVLNSVSQRCRGPLRRSAARQLLWQVSYSNLRRSAFPGVGGFAGRSAWISRLARGRGCPRPRRRTGARIKTACH